MATLLELDADGSVSRYDPELGPGQLEERCLYVLPALVTRIQDWLPEQGSSWNIEIEPHEQVAAMLADYCAGHILKIGAGLKALSHLGDGIWEMKTADVRIFGWFHQKDCFIGASLDIAETIKTSKLYAGYCSEAVWRRSQLDLNMPKFIGGDDPNAVVSNYSFS
jgi:hypothetical protein